MAHRMRLFSRVMSGVLLFRLRPLGSPIRPTLSRKGGGPFPQMFAEEFVKAYERHIAESMRAHRGGQLPSIKLEPLDEAEYMAELAATQRLDKPVEHEDQPGVAPEAAPGEVLEGIDNGDELIDFDQLEDHLSDDSDQAKG